MKVFTKLGLAFLVIVLSSGMLWAQESLKNEAAQKKQAMIQRLVEDQILDMDPDAKPTNITFNSDDLFDLQFSWPAGVGGGEAGLETDGNYVYTTKWNGAGEFYRYGMDGTYIEVFTIAGATGIRDLAYNGTYFYGAPASTSVKELDLANETLISSFTAPTAVRAIAYNEDDDVFYGNNWSTNITVFDMAGANLGSWATGPAGASYYGFAYDNYCGGQYLWGYCQPGATPATQNVIVQMALPSGAETGVTFDVATVVTPVTGIAGGLCITDQVVTGYWTIMGNMQNEFIWGLELCASGPLPTNDIGIQAIVEPSTGMGLTSAEDVTVTIKNHGTDPQSNFDVSFTLDGGTPVTETYSGTLNGGETVDHTFGTTVDLSAMGTYEFEACTDLTGDENTGNDCKTKTVENLSPAYCDATTTTEDEWIANVLFGSIDNSSGWQGGVADYTDQSTAIPQGGSEDITVTNGTPYTSDATSVWVDWNNDYVFATGGDEEYVLTNDGTGEFFTGTISVPAGTPEGDYRMRVRLIYNGVPNPCGNSTYGEVEDYTVTVGSGGSSAIFEDDFESYTAGQQLACQDPIAWTTWSNLPCDATEDAYVSDLYAASGSNSVNIVTNNDLVKNLDTYFTSGKYSISLMLYVPAGADGYYNVMSDFDGGYEWGFEVYFNTDGTGELNAGGTASATFNYSQDTWMDSEVIVDLDNDWAEYYLDGSMIHEWQWTVGAAGGGAALQLAAVDFFGANATTDYYFDDFMIEDASVVVPLDPPTNLTANLVGADDDDVELNWDAPAVANGEWIQWDAGTNDDGIGLTAGGTFYSASHWMPADLAPYDGQEITMMSFFAYGDPAATYTLMAWTGANAGTQIMSQTVATFTVDDWNEITLTTPITIDASEELWFGLETTHGANTFPVGVDAGPAVANNGDMISLDGTTWVSMSIEYSLDFNWNLAAYVMPTDASYAPVPMAKATNPNASGSFATSGVGGNGVKFIPSTSKALNGYNVYRDGSMIDYVTVTTYLDEDLSPGTYDYYVTAVYDEGESDPSNMETVTVPGGTGGDIFCDDFESYTVGQQLVSQNPTDWTTWSGTAGNAEDPFVVDNSGNVVEITGTNDLVYVMPNYTDDAYMMSFDMYVPTGADGYFNTLQEFAGASSQWGMQVYFGETNPGEGNIDGGGALAALFTFDYDTWMNIKVIVDLDNDWGEFYLDDVLIHGWVWSSGSFGTGTLNQLGGNNFYAWDGGAYANPQFHIDNYCLSEYENVVLDPPTNVTATLDGSNDVLVEWEAPAGGGSLVELVQHDGNNANGYFQSYDNGYGVVYDISGYPGATLEYVDFRHSSWGVMGTWDYKLHVVDWNTYTEVDVTGVLQTTGNDVWEENISIGSIAGQSGLVGIFLEPMSNDPADAYPCLDSDDVGPDGMSYFGPLSDYSGMTLSEIGDFLMDLWIMTDDGEKIQLKPVKPNVNSAISATGRMGNNPVSIAPYIPQQQSYAGKSVEVLEGYNVYRDGDEIAYVSVPTTEYLDEDLAPGTYDYCVRAIYTEGQSPEACADPVTVPNPTPPPAPENLQLNVVVDDIELTWEEPGNEWMRWDAGVNNGNGIGLTGGGTFSVSSHWDPASLAEYNGLSIETITFYANADPAATYTIKVWTGANGLNEVYSQAVPTFTVDDWNDIALTTPVEINGNDHLWFGYEVTHGDATFPAGCDDGPAVAGYGDMILTGGAWASLVGLVPTLDYNWNLAAFVVAADGKSQLMSKPVVPAANNGQFAESGATGVTNKFNPSGSKELTGYNVYYSMDGGAFSVLDNVTTNSYTHVGNAVVVGEHCYQVTAVYDPQGESDPTEEECYTFVSVTENGVNTLQVYPNPARDVVNVKSDVTINSITVYNYSGQVVANERVENTVYTVNTSELRSGIYFFQIDTDQGRTSQRIVIE